jgi:WD40 repeat protein
MSKYTMENAVSHSQGSRLLGFVVAFVLLVFAISLAIMRSGHGSNEQSGFRTQIVPAPTGTYLAGYGMVAWVGDWLIVEYGKGVSVYDNRLWQLHTDGSDMHQMQLPPYPGCVRNGYTSPTRLPDGRLGYAVACDDRSKEAPVYYLVAYDMQSKQATPLLKSPLRVNYIRGFSMDPTMTRGFITDSAGFFDKERLMTFTAGRAEYFDTRGAGPVSYAGKWSPDGKQIAFLAGGPGFYKPFALYLMSSDGTSLRMLKDNVYGATSLAWSPDGRFLIYKNSEQGGKPSKVYYLVAVEVSTGKDTVIGKALYNFLAWSPDGASLVATVSTGDAVDPNDPPESHLEIIDVGSLPAVLGK